jgi:hypothetical protein
MISPLDKHGEGTGGQPDCSGSSLKDNESFILYKAADRYCGNNPGPMRVLSSAPSPANPDKQIQGEFSANTASGDLPSRLFT